MYRLTRQATDQRVPRTVRFALVAGMILSQACTSDSGIRPIDPQPVARVTLDRTSLTLPAGEQTRLTATPRDANGNALTGRTIRWTSSDATVASVNSTGVVTAHRAETAIITAVVESKSARASVTVRAPDGYDLVYSAWPDIPVGDWRLFRTRLGSGVSQPIIPPEVLQDFGFSRASVSPDGRRIVFAGFQTYGDAVYVFTANADGSDMRQLTTGGREGQPTWSPDGRKIAYVRWPRDQDADIWVMNADGTEPVNVTASMGNLNQYSPDWSSEMSEGSRIVFGEGDRTYSNLWTMRPDGSDRRQVTSGQQWWDDDASWSPDGTRIAFMREGPGTGGQFEIWVADATGATASLLVNLPDSQLYPAWSPDGRLIAFTSHHAEPFAIYTVWSDGTRLTRRTSAGVWSNQPTWAAKQ